jgi:hypothetical protein
VRRARRYERTAAVRKQGAAGNSARAPFPHVSVAHDAFRCQNGSPWWRLEPNLAEENLIRHLVRPRFAACWRSGEAPSPARLVTCRAISGRIRAAARGVDSLHLFAFVWGDPPPEGDGRERLLKEAAGASAGCDSARHRAIHAARRRTVWRAAYRERDK